MGKRGPKDSTDWAAVNARLFLLGLDSKVGKLTKEDIDNRFLDHVLYDLTVAECKLSGFKRPRGNSGGKNQGGLSPIHYVPPDDLKACARRVLDDLR